MVDKFSLPLPPPPPLDSKDTVIPERIIDSLREVKMTVAVHPRMGRYLDSRGMKEIPQEFKTFIDTTLHNNYINTVKDFYSKKRHTIVLADTLELKKSYDFDDFDMLFSFSRIWYNTEKTKAVFELGVSRSRLWGSATIFCLEKEKESWHVVKSIPTTMW
ncbi:hypothetical protein LVD13_13110 [Flavobacteriaceae bacterium D16]|nr:hypothetical protein [Flavobacteriaceae bacterium D16]